MFFGGIDADNYTGLAIKALADMDIKGMHVDVVIGVQHPYREEIKKECAELGFVCHVQTDKMAELMAAADLSIGAGGSTLWERCCLGLPTLAVSIAENQRLLIIDAAEAGLLYAPTNNTDVASLISRHLAALLENSALLKLISRADIQTVDGKGVIRAVNAMKITEITIRRATELDALQLFEWRNHPTIRAVSKNKAPILWQDHQAWLSAVIADHDRELLVGESANQPVGVVRFDNIEEVAEVSIYLVPDSGFDGQGKNSPNAGP